MADTKTSYTPGPWTMRKFPGAKLLEVRAAAGQPLVVNWGGFDDGDRPLEEHQANARIIAAAPDLLEALTGLLADIEDYQTRNQLGGHDNHCQVMARAAIEKALGHD